MCGSSDLPNVQNDPVAGSPNFHAIRVNGHLAELKPQFPAATDTTQLKDHGYTTDPSKHLPEDDIGHMTFTDAYSRLSWADDDVAPGFEQGWNEVSEAITVAYQDFKAGLDAERSSADGWKGDTAKAALDNADESVQVPQALAGGATALGTLAGAFSTTMAATKKAIVGAQPTNAQPTTLDNLDGYNSLLKADPDHHDAIVNTYNYYAQKVLLDDYLPNTTTIRQNAPGFSTAVTPTVGGGPTDLGPSAPLRASKTPVARVQGPPGSLGGPVGGLGALGGAAGGLRSLAGLNIPKTPFTPLPSPVPLTTEKLAEPLGGTNRSAPLDSSALSASGLQQGLSNALSPLQALGQAANAARPQGNPGGGPGMPEGVLSGLGPKGSAKAGGAAGGGVAPRGISTGKPASAPATAVTSAAGRAAPVSRAGLINGTNTATAGPPGAGAPGAGQHGGGQGGQHQPSKALKGRKNGEQIIGAADAVVAVLGGQAAKPEAT
jgi:hypothetical protein